jgi:hypothetical protein
MSTITEGQELPSLDVPLTASVIVAGAIASRDFMPVHHDKSYANAQGAPDVFMNILTTNGYVSRFVTDWAGPDAMVRRIAIRLGVPALPGGSLRFTGRVASVTAADGERTVVVEVRGATDIGDHVTGQVTLTLP